jgi:site-specific DNA-methyltransferase (adenine-specific)
MNPLIERFRTAFVRHPAQPKRLINTVLAGDCIEVLPQLSAGSIDFVLTDPPYFVRYETRDGRTVQNDNCSDWLIPAFGEIYRVLKPHSFCVSFYGWPKADLFLSAFRSAGFRPVGHISFVKDYVSRVGYMEGRHEVAYLLAKGRPCRPEDPPSDVIPFPYQEEDLHPTQKPVSSLALLVDAFSKAGDVVLDPFSGSGSSLVAAKQCGRNYLGIELDPWYVEASTDRLNRVSAA